MEDIIMENKHPAIIGVDVSKDTLEAALLFTDNSFAEAQFSNDAKGIKQLLAWASKHRAPHCRICVEATGGFEFAVCKAGYLAQHPIRIVRPAQVAGFRQSLGMHNKTDRDDARLIALFAFAVDGKDWQMPSPTALALRDARKVRRQLVKDHTGLSNCMKTLCDARQKKRAAENLRYFDKQIAKQDAEMEQIIAQDEQLAELKQLLCSITGIGTQTAIALCAVFNDKTFDNAEQFAVYVGLNPRRRQSGNYEAKAHISKMGDAELRTLLFMAALSARVHNPIIRAFADQLSRRRPELTKKQIIVACAHKLARIIYGILRYRKPFDPNYCCASAS